MSLVPFAAALPFLLIGFHLLLIARRSGAVPDRLLSAFFLLIGCGIAPRIAAVDLSTSGAGLSVTAFVLNTTANLLIGSALVCLAAFVWRVFHPTAAWAKNLTIAFGLVLCSCLVAAARTLDASSGASPIAITFNAAGAAALSWAFVECIRYHQLMRRRRALGMTDPVVANRFLLWSIWTGAIALQATLLVALRIGIWWSGAEQLLGQGLDPGGSWLLLIQVAKASVAVIAPIVVVAVALSFSPPARYRHWLHSRHAQPSGV